MYLSSISISQFWAHQLKKRSLAIDINIFHHKGPIILGFAGIFSTKWPKYFPIFRCKNEILCLILLVPSVMTIDKEISSKHCLSTKIFYTMSLRSNWLINPMIYNISMDLCYQLMKKLQKIDRKYYDMENWKKVVLHAFSLLMILGISYNIPVLW